MPECYDRDCRMFLKLFSEDSRLLKNNKRGEFHFHRMAKIVFLLWKLIILTKQFQQKEKRVLLREGKLLKRQVENRYKI